MRNSTPDGIYANRLSSPGVLAAGSPFRMSAASPSLTRRSPWRRRRRVRGGLRYRPRNGLSPRYRDVGVRRELATLDRLSGFDPAVSINGSDHYLVTYTRFNSSSGHNDIFSRRDFLS